MNRKDSLSEKLGMYLKYLRKQSGLKLEEISEKSCLSISYISRLENGLINAPSLDTIEALAEAYDVSVFELLNLSIEKDENVMSLEELIIKNDFIYNNRVVDSNTKYALINLINSLVESDMGDHIEEVANICYLLCNYAREAKGKEVKCP